MKKNYIIQRLQTYSNFYRLGRPLEVGEEMVNFLTEILPFLFFLNNNNSASIEELFSGILACQEAEDWLGLADYLEYDLPSFLENLS